MINSDSSLGYGDGPYYNPSYHPQSSTALERELFSEMKASPDLLIKSDSFRDKWLCLSDPSMCYHQRSDLIPLVATRSNIYFSFLSAGSESHIVIHHNQTDVSTLDVAFDPPSHTVWVNADPESKRCGRFSIPVSGRKYECFYVIQSDSDDLNRPETCIVCGRCDRMEYEVVRIIAGHKTIKLLTALAYLDREAGSLWVVDWSAGYAPDSIAALNAYSLMQLWTVCCYYYGSNRMCRTTRN